jgi:iron complex outermembrane receptor protein
MRATPLRLAQAQPAPAPPPVAPPTPDPVPAPDAAPAPVVPEAAPPPPPTVAPAIPEPIAAEPTPPTEGEVIMVTGSRIGDPLGKQSPVLMMSREDIDRTGLTSVGDILQQLPVSGGAINGKFNSSGNFGFPPDGGGIGAGAIEADLRYLGSKRVLILVDGVRWVNGSSASGIAASTDLNTIPLSIVDHIEVLEDGASPIYGSDAIAGVINIITRKEMSGAIASVYTGAFHKGDGFTQKYDVSWGASSTKTSIIVGASYLDQRTVFSRDREISAFVTPEVGRCTDRCSGTTPQGRIKYIRPGETTVNDVTLNDGVLNDGVTKANVATDYHPFTNDDRFNFADYNLVETPSKRIGAFSSLTYKLLPNINLRGKASFLNRQSLNQAAPEPLAIGPDAGNGNRMDHIKIDANNEFNPFGYTLDSETNLRLITHRPEEAGPRRFEQDVNTFYMSGGLDGHFDVGSQRFTWDATAAYGLNRATQRRKNSFNSLKLEQGLGPSYQTPDGVWHCGTPTNPGDPSCTPINFFGGQGPAGTGSLTPEMLAFATFTEHDVSEQTLFDSVANITGNLVKLPAGWLAAAAGVEYRQLSGYYEPDAIVAAGDGADVPSQPSSGSYSVSEAYAELRAPIIANKPGAQLIDINAAARISDYSFLTPELTGKVGLRYKPVQDLILRGSYSRGFRAPSIGEAFGSKSRFDAMLVDPCNHLNTGVAADVANRCVALGVPADGSYTQANSQISIATGGNPALKPETSDSFNASLAYSPAALQNRGWISSLDFELAYYDIRVDGAISAIGAQDQLDRCIAGDDTSCKGIERNSIGVISSFSNALLNLGGISTRGWDLNIGYRSPRTEIGRLRAVWSSSYLLSYREKVPTSDGFKEINHAGKVDGTPERAFPKFKAQLALGWLLKSFDITLITRYIHSMTEPCRGFTDYPTTCSDFAENDADSTNHLGATVYNDVQVLWSPDFDHGLTITAGVNNLLDRDPPACFSCSLNGFNGQTYDVPGIFGYLSATYHMQ